MSTEADSSAEAAPSTAHKDDDASIADATASTKRPMTQSNKKRKNMTVLDKIVYTLRAIRSGPKGSSRVAIAKYLKSEFDYDNTIAIKKALSQGLGNKRLTQIQQSFLVTGDAHDIISATAAASVEAKVTMFDVVVGKGDLEADHGDVVTIQYVGTLEDDGTEFDSARKFTFLLGAGEVVKGMDRGVMGMRQGGKRKITIPSKLGYGKRGSPPEIPKNAALQFEIVLKKLERI